MTKEELEKRLALAEKLLEYIFNPNFLFQSPPEGYKEVLEEWLKLKRGSSFKGSHKKSTS